VSIRGPGETTATESPRQRAQVSVATIYRGFPTKQHLIVAALRMWPARFTNAMQPELTPISNPYNKLWHLIDRLTEAIQRDRQSAETFAGAYASADVTAPAQGDRVRQHLIATLTDAKSRRGQTGPSRSTVELLADEWALNVLALVQRRASPVVLRRRIALTTKRLARRSPPPLLNCVLPPADNELTLQ
jgi:TetR/AcrR family transcriptional regulator, cholesterol catabolism regulator